MSLALGLILSAGTAMAAVPDAKVATTGNDKPIVVLKQSTEMSACTPTGGGYHYCCSKAGCFSVIIK